MSVFGLRPFGVRGRHGGGRVLAGVHDESRVRPETTMVKMVGTFLVSLSCDLPVSVTFRSMLWQLLRKVAFLTLVCHYFLKNS